MTDIFISHAAKNKKLAEKFRDHILVCGIGVNPRSVYCTSTPGQIPNGTAFVKHILSNLSKAKVVVALVSREYNDRDFCLEEAGAAQLLSEQGKAPCLLYLVPPASFSTSLGGMLFGVQAEMLDDHSALQNLKPQIENLLGFTTTTLPAVYNNQITEFLKYVKEAEELSRLNGLRVIDIAYDDKRGVPTPKPLHFKLKLRIDLRNDTGQKLEITKIGWHANKAVIKPSRSPTGVTCGISVAGNQTLPASVSPGMEFNVWIGLRETQAIKDLRELHENEELGRLTLSVRISGYDGEWEKTF